MNGVLKATNLDFVPTIAYKPGGLSRRALMRVESFIKEHLGDPVTLDDLARAAGISRFYFARLFRTSTGESPMRYLQRLRVELAKDLLAQGDSKISDIAMTVGFYDQSHFSRRFRDATGTTPRQFAHATFVSPVPVPVAGQHRVFEMPPRHRPRA